MNIQGAGQYYAGYQPMQMRRAGGMSGGFNPSDIDASKIIKNNDTNQDGVISADETKMSSDMFSHADADGDGQLTSNELEEMLANGPPMNGMNRMGGMGGMGGGIDVTTILDQEDEDGDGTISQEESRLTDELFSSIDENQDGVLTAEEIEKGLENRNPQTGQMPGAQSGLTLDQQTAMDAYYNAMQSLTSGYSANQDEIYWNSIMGVMA